MKQITTLIVSLFIFGTAFAQNIGINANGATPHPSALLDIDGSALPGFQKGLLIPRMTTVQRDAIPLPPEGLIVYNTTTHCVDYYNGKIWIGCMGVSQCPPGMVAINTRVSIEYDFRPPDTWYNANLTCMGLGARLCTWGEWYTACALGAAINMTGMGEWADDSGGGATSPKILGITFGDCESGTSDLATTTRRFRCCCDR